MCVKKVPSLSSHLPRSWMQLISEDLGLKLEKIEPEMLGAAKKVTISKDDTIILDGAGDKAVIEERLEQVKSSLDSQIS